MADPTIKDAVKLLEAMRRDTASLATRENLAAVAADVKALDAKVDAGFAAVRKDVADLDADLERHMAAHREIEEDIETLKKRPARTAARPTRAPRRR